MLTQKEIINILDKLNIKCDDTILIHSSLKNIGPIEGNASGLIDTLCNYLNKGLLIFPTHTWNIMNKDNMIFNCQKTPSCVGMLTNIALNTKGFIRSTHPTHSVCAYGIKAKEYIKNDLTATTPVGPNNCFGILKNYNAKILFLGAPLSKNTFIHSIEEEFKVPNLFTDHIFHFISQNNDQLIDYYMPKHYSTLSEHISDHYEKLLPILIKNNACTMFKFGNAKSYLVDAKKCYDIVCNILKKDIHAFDSFKDISNLLD